MFSKGATNQRLGIYFISKIRSEPYMEISGFKNNFTEAEIHYQVLIFTNILNKKFNF